MQRISSHSRRIRLNGTWKLYFRQVLPTIPLTTWDLKTTLSVEAQVPGNVEIDLYKAGLLPDLTKGNNVYEAIRLESYQWNYERSFIAPEINNPASQRVYLIFEGIDCLATILLNNQNIGTADNMLIPYEFDITDALVPGENILNVCIDAAVVEGRKYNSPPLDYALPGKWEAQHIRKASHMYGWDIMPRIVSAGLWRDVYLETRNATHFDYVYWATQQVDIKNHNAELALDWQFTTDQHPLYDWQIEVHIGKQRQNIFQERFPVLGTRGKKRLQVENIEFWWPNGYGKQSLYDVVLKLVDGSGNVQAKYQERIGIRTIKLDYKESTADTEVSEFKFIVNGVDIYVRGTNWVPLDALHSRDQRHLLDILPMVLDLNCTMVRCWGGNVYEGHDFFDYCDENGIMVWQDFAQACNRSPQTVEFADKMKREARTIVSKLRNHPSLALWCGNNENDVALGWTGMDFIPPYSDIISRKVLPVVVQEYDPFRSYLPSSPYISDEFFHKNKQRTLLPEDHLWGPRGYFKDPFYTETKARFVSEAGYHGCPSRETLEEMMDPEYVYPWLDNDTWNVQWVCKAVTALPNDQEFGQHRNNLMTKQIRLLFGEVPVDLDDFILASQITQAEAMKFLVEYWRQGKGTRTGMLWWNLRDGWPILSDAVVDYYGRKKLAYTYLKRSQQDIAVIVGEPESGEHPVYVINDTLSALQGKYFIHTVSGNSLIPETAITIPANSRQEICRIRTPRELELWLLHWTLVHRQPQFNHYIAGKPPFSLEMYKKWLPTLTEESECR
jgi:beta-mannosidase